MPDAVTNILKRKSRFTW